MGLIVAKFGGWANSTSERVKLACDLFEKNPDRKVKINSAIGKVEGLPKVTDLLIEGSEDALKTGVFPEEILEKIRLNHYSVFEPLGITKKKIDEVVGILETYIKRKEELSPDYFRALIVGSGEELFSRLDAYYMKEIRGLKASYVDPREIGHYLEGNPLDGKIKEESYKNLSKLKDIEGIIVYPGFFAVDTKGRPMIYSRGGTDKTASDIAASLDASSYENWKDVDGVYCTDPRVVPNPKLMHEVTYKEIRELSYISFNVLHQEAMLPVMKAGIPINLKNLMKPDSEGTLIVNTRKVDTENPVVGIAHLENICFINIEKNLMNEEIGFADRLLSIFREHRISIDQITTGIDSIGLSVSEKEFDQKSTYTGIAEGVRKSIDITEFANYLKTQLKADKVQVRRNKALICVVGEGMRHTVGVLSRISRALFENKINIETIDQGPSERNIVFGVDCSKDKDNAKKAVNAIYNEFFK
jgi:aspartate kinase